MFKRLVALLALSLSLVVTQLSFGSHAAMAAWNSCPVGEVCWWAGANGSGEWGHRTPLNIWNAGCWSMGAFGNTASSWRIRLSGTGWQVFFWDAGTCQSVGSTPFLDIGGGDQQANFVGAYNNWLGGINVVPS